VQVLAGLEGRFALGVKDSTKSAEINPSAEISFQIGIELGRLQPQVVGMPFRGTRPPRREAVVQRAG